MWWATEELPETVYPGKVVHLIGRFQSFNGGQKVQVTDALPFHGNYPKIMRTIAKYLLKYADEPAHWHLDKKAE